MTDIDPKVLLARAYQRIVDHPELWDQTEFNCGAAGCLIGHMAELHPDFREWESPYTISPDVLIADRWRNIEEWAMEFLNLDYDQLAVIADPHNTLAQLKAGVMAYIYGADIRRAVDGAA